MKNNGTKKYDVVALGSCTLDMIFSVNDIMRMELIDRDGVNKKYVAIENSSKINVKALKFYPGGSAANIACDVSNLGFSAAYLGGVGNDAAAETCLKDMQKHKVDVSKVITFEDEATAHSVILITPWGRDRSIMAYKGTNDLYSKEHVPEEMLKQTRAFAWTSLTSDQSINAIQHCINITRAYGGLVVGAPSISVIKKRLNDAINLLKQSDTTSMNEEEIEALTGEKDVHKAMQILLDWGLKLVNVTMGKDGAWMTTKDSNKLIKTSPPKVIVSDTTGAGDATMAGIVYGYLMGKTPEEMGRIAAGMSGMEIESEGVRVGLPEKFADLEKFMNSHEITQQISEFTIKTVESVKK